MTLTISDIPRDWVHRLESRARQHGRSVEQEVLHLIEVSVTDREEIFRRIRDRWAQLPSVSPTEAKAWIEEGRL